MSANPRHLILNLLVGAGGDSLSARNAVASSALFAISENRTRVALARLAAAGLIEAVGRGAYRIRPHPAEPAADVARRPRYLEAIPQYLKTALPDAARPASPQTPLETIE
jgi:DNA-binding FadR family transcriptional regulator